jgi:protein required for attachment to host cells
VLVAGLKGARLYRAQPADAPRARVRLVECALIPAPDARALGSSVSGRPRTETNTSRQAGPMHPIDAQRQRHRASLLQRYADEVARRAAGVTRPWRQGVLLVVAAPRTLGLLRPPLRKALPRGIDIEELARDYAGLSLAALQQRLPLQRLLRRAAPPLSATR